MTSVKLLSLTPEVLCPRFAVLCLANLLGNCLAKFRAQDGAPLRVLFACGFASLRRAAFFERLVVLTHASLHRISPPGLTVLCVHAPVGGRAGFALYLRLRLGRADVVPDEILRRAQGFRATGAPVIEHFLLALFLSDTGDFLGHQRFLSAAVRHLNQPIFVRFIHDGG